MKKQIQSKKQDTARALFWVKAISGAAACRCTCVEDSSCCSNTSDCFMA